MKTAWYRLVSLAAAAVVGMVLATPPLASAEPVACKRSISTSLAKFVQGKTKILRKCNEGVLAGKQAGPCPDAATAARITRLAGKLRRTVSERADESVDERRSRTGQRGHQVECLLGDPLG